jgi:hypothetical protein
LPNVPVSDSKPRWENPGTAPNWWKARRHEEFYRLLRELQREYDSGNGGNLEDPRREAANRAFLSLASARDIDISDELRPELIDDIGWGGIRARHIRYLDRAADAYARTMIRGLWGYKRGAQRFNEELDRIHDEELRSIDPEKLEEARLRARLSTG